jgi:glutamine synthetase adenylyltransferase
MKTSLADKMDKITEKFNKSLDTAEELESCGNEFHEMIQEKSKDLNQYDDISMNEIVNLENMVNDFSFVRETLKENTENGRRVLNSITLELLDEDADKKKQASLIMSFAELNKSVADNMKLYIQSYREISTILLNLDKIKKNNTPKEGNPIDVNPENSENISTTDLIKQLKTKGND